VLAELEWGIVLGRLVLAAGLLSVPALAPELSAVQPVTVATAGALLISVPLFAWLLSRGRTEITLCTGIVVDTVVVGALALASVWLLQQDRKVELSSGASVLAGLPTIVLIIVAVLRLRPVPAAVFAIGVPLTQGLIAHGLDINLPGLTGLGPRVLALSGTGLAVIAVAYPIQRTRAALQKEVQSKVDLVSTVAHELRGPLTTVRAYIDLIGDEASGPLSAEQRELLQRASRSALRMEQMTNLFMLLERADDPSHQLTPAAVELAPIVEQVVKDFGGVAADRDIALNVTCLNGLPNAWGDAASVEEVLTNLISNAIKFSPDQTTVSVGGRETPGGVAVYVSDQGLGMSAEDQEHVFERFFRSTDPRKRRTRGTGLGLYVSRRLIEKQGGTLTFESQLGSGSTFTFTLPVAPAPSA
jgi:signal transduction histidine kinase